MLYEAGAVSRVTRDDGPDFIHIGEVGTVGGMQGVNEHGIAIDIETGADREAFIYPEDGLLTHSNHFCAPDVDSEVVRLWPNTMYRHVRLERLLRQSQELEVSTIKSAMADHFAHPHSICAHYDEDEPENLRLETNHSVVISLKQRTLHITDTQPCRSSFEEYPLAA